MGKFLVFFLEKCSLNSGGGTGVEEEKNKNDFICKFLVFLKNVHEFWGVLESKRENIELILWVCFLNYSLNSNLAVRLYSSVDRRSHSQLARFPK